MIYRFVLGVLAMEHLCVYWHIRDPPKNVRSVAVLGLHDIEEKLTLWHFVCLQLYLKTISPDELIILE